MLSCNWQCIQPACVLHPACRFAYLQLCIECCIIPAHQQPNQKQAHRPPNKLVLCAFFLLHGNITLIPHQSTNCNPLPLPAVASLLSHSSCGLQVEALTTSKAELKTQVRNLLSSQTDLLTRVSTLTAKWQQAVSENAALHRQNLQMAARQGA